MGAYVPVEELSAAVMSIASLFWSVPGTVLSQARRACAFVAILGLCVGLWDPGARAAEPLDGLPTFKTYRSARVSSADPTGGNHDSIRLGPGETKTVADLAGPGCVTHIWITHLYGARGGLRKLVLRAWFDDARTPCIESPLGDFFGLGHAYSYWYAGEPLAVGSGGGLNSFWRMPFSRRARFAITNEGHQACDSFFFYVDYQTYPHAPRDRACFHAQYRQAFPCVKGEPYIVLEARGRGHYVGCNLSVEQREEGWWGEGDDLFCLDGETSPSIRGTGSEDYFSGAWCFSNEFAFPYFGMPLRGRVLADGRMDRCSPDLTFDDAKEWHWPVAWRKGDLWNVYRYHLEGPIAFSSSVRFVLEHGFRSNERQDAYSSVAYWYQDHPHTAQPPLPTWRDRVPFYQRLQDRGDGLFEAEDFVDDAVTTSGRLGEPGMLFWGRGSWSRDALLEWNPPKPGVTLTLPVPIPNDGRYEVLLVAARTRRGGTFEVLLNGRSIHDSLNLFEPSIFPVRETYGLGVFDLTQGRANLVFRSTGRDPDSQASVLSLDTIQFRPAPETGESEGASSRREAPPP